MFQNCFGHILPSLSASSQALHVPGGAYKVTGISHIYSSVKINCVSPFTESQNHRMVGVGRDLCGSSSPTLLSKQGHLQQASSALAGDLHTYAGLPGGLILHLTLLFPAMLSQQECSSGKDEGAYNWIFIHIQGSNSR